MPNWLYRTLKALKIVEYCPNCASAFTGGHPNPEDLTHCIVCGNRKGEITGWVWSRLVDPYCWVGRAIVSRNMDTFNKNKDTWNTTKGN